MDIGDRVRVITRHSTALGKTGTLSKSKNESYDYLVEFDDDTSSIHYNENELKLVKIT